MAAYGQDVEPFEDRLRQAHEAAADPQNPGRAVPPDDQPGQEPASPEFHGPVALGGVQEFLRTVEKVSREGPQRVVDVFE